MREIKFRGKSIKTGEWFYGTYHYSADNKHHYILNREKFNEGENSHVFLWHQEVHEVDPNTVGQFIGLTDKNGVEIYEGDIICNHEHQEWDWRGIIKFYNGVFGAEWLPNIKSQSMVGAWGQKHNLRKLDDDILERQIIIGNIHDNPELLTP